MLITGIRSPVVSKVLRIATRESRLAMSQAQLVKSRIEQQGEDIHVELVGFNTTGDHMASDGTSLEFVGGKGSFVKEVEQSLCDGCADIAIHSMKDVPTNVPEGFSVFSVCERADSRDALLGKNNILNLRPNDRVGSSSKRRTALLRQQIRDIGIYPVRGNVDTRLKKLDAGTCDALILAAAGLDRLELGHRINQRLDPGDFVPSAGQGALAAECLCDRKDMIELIQSIQEEQTESCVRIERSIANMLNADCSSAIGVHCLTENGQFHVAAVVLDESGSQCIRVKMRNDNAQKLISDCVKSLYKMGAQELLHSA